MATVVVVVVMVEKVMRDAFFWLGAGGCHGQAMVAAVHNFTNRRRAVAPLETTAPSGTPPKKMRRTNSSTCSTLTTTATTAATVATAHAPPHDENG